MCFFFFFEKFFNFKACMGVVLSPHLSLCAEGWFFRTWPSFTWGTLIMWWHLKVQKWTFVNAGSSLTSSTLSEATSKCKIPVGVVLLCLFGVFLCAECVSSSPGPTLCSLTMTSFHFSMTLMTTWQRRLCGSCPSGSAPEMLLGPTRDEWSWSGTLMFCYRPIQGEAGIDHTVKLVYTDSHHQ